MNYIIKNRTKGFSLVELAMVLTVFGLLLVIGFQVMKPITDRAKRTETVDRVGEAVDAVMGYAAINRRLPTKGEFAAMIGEGTDVWGNNLIYVPADKLAEEDGICSTLTTSMVVELCGDSGCTVDVETASNTAFFLMSSGPNLNIQTNYNVDTTVEPIVVYKPDVPLVDDYATGLSREEAYKDITKWVVLPEVRLAIPCGGPPLRILDTPLPPGLLGHEYDIDIYAIGGVPFDDEGEGFGDGDELDDITEPDYEWCNISGLPGGMYLDCNGVLDKSTACNLGSGTWQQCTSLSIEGTPTTDGSFMIHVFAKDDNGNIDDNIFVLTINRLTGDLNVCEEYFVWNYKPAVQTDYLVRKGYDEVNDPVTSVCTPIPLAAEVTSGIYLDSLEPLHVVEQHQTSNASCSGMTVRLSFNNAIMVDANQDCCVKIDGNNMEDFSCAGGNPCAGVPAGVTLSSQTLCIIGTASCENILVEEDVSDWHVVADFDGAIPIEEEWYDQDDVDLIYIETYDCADIIDLDSTVDIPSYVDAGVGDDVVDGGSGNDIIHGRDGGDTIQGNDGDDTLYGEAGNDDLDGGNDTDYCDGGPDGDSFVDCETELN